MSFILLFVLLTGLCPGGRAEHILMPDSLASETAILIDAATGAPLFEKNADRAMYPASTTKIMTCLLALEYGDLDAQVVIPEEAGSVPKDSSLMPVAVGEVMSLRDLLYGLMLHSGNDSANAVAALVGGSVENFVAMMNARAAQIGMTGTHFSNAHGYHADDHYSTARDLALLAQEAMRNEEFRKIVGTPAYIIEPTNKRAERLKMVNSNLMLISETDYYYDGMSGIKTGYTGAAGQTFVFAAERNGACVIGVSMKAGDNKDSPLRWNDAKTMLDYGFTRYRNYSFAELYAMSPATVQVANAIETDPQAGDLSLSMVNVAGEYSVACLDGDASAALADFQAKRQYTITADLTAPIAAGAIIGSVSYTTEDGQSVTGTLIASRSVDEQPQTITAADIFPFLEGVDLAMAGQILKIGGIALAVLLIVRAVLRARRRALRRKQRRAARRRTSYGQPGTYRGGRDRYYN
ncbi:MAG: D-alanyl-D-alanine carboxypeptidase family protein [Eubacteriales bacterium]|nr:D-alanyl-D-alanine carboxypeptidase family protein [Eubacteriales bacterium]